MNVSLQQKQMFILLNANNNYAARETV